jgi:hypothetical protein
VSDDSDDDSAPKQRGRKGGVQTGGRSQTAVADKSVGAQTAVVAKKGGGDVGAQTAVVAKRGGGEAKVVAAELARTVTALQSTFASALEGLGHGGVHAAAKLKEIAGVHLNPDFSGKLLRLADNLSRRRVGVTKEMLEANLIAAQIRHGKAEKILAEYQEKIDVARKSAEVAGDEDSKGDVDVAMGIYESVAKEVGKWKDKVAGIVEEIRNLEPSDHDLLVDVRTVLDNHNKDLVRAKREMSSIIMLLKIENNVSFPDGGFATTGKETGASGCIRRLPGGGNRVDAEET